MWLVGSKAPLAVHAVDDVTFTAPVPESKWRAGDPNPRGGQRGARGISVHGDRVVLANAESLFVFDRSWRLLRQISRPLLADIHDVLAEERGITATRGRAPISSTPFT